MKKNNAKNSVIFDFLKDTGREKYEMIPSLMIIFLSALMFSYTVYRIFSGYFSAADLIASNANVESPLILSLVTAFFLAVFTAVLYFDKKRFSVLLHHLFSLGMVVYYFTASAKNSWPEYDNPFYIISGCLLIAFYAGYLFEKLSPSVKQYSAVIEKQAVFAAAAACALYFLYFAWLGLERHALFFSQMYDMAWENQALYNLSHFGVPYSTIENTAGAVNWGDHASLIYYLLAFLYRLFPRPEFLIIFQAFAVSLSGFLVFILSKNALKSKTAGLLILFVFLLHPSVQGWLLQDFHPAVLAVPLFFAFMIYAEKKNFAFSLGFFIAMALVREDLAFFAFFAGLYMMAVKKGTGPLRGIVFPAAALLIAVLMLMLMKVSGGGLTDMKRFYSMSPGFAGIIQQLFLNPFYVFSQLFNADKAAFIAVTSAPLLFIFYRVPAVWIMLVPAMIFGVLSKYEPHFLLGYHYSVLFICAAFAGFIQYFSGNKKQITPYIAGTMIALSFMLSYFYGNVFSKSLRLVYAELQLAPVMPDYNLKGWIGMYRGLKGEKDPEALKIAASIPKEYKVAADYFFSAHVSGRRYIYQLAYANDAAVVIDRKGSGGYAGFTALKETGRWVFYVRDSIISEGKAGLADDASVFFR